MQIFDVPRWGRQGITAMHGTIISTTVAAMLALSGLGAHRDAAKPDAMPVAWSQPAGDAGPAGSVQIPATPKPAQ